MEVLNLRFYKARFWRGNTEVENVARLIKDYKIGVTMRGANCGLAHVLSGKTQYKRCYFFADKTGSEK